MKIAVIGSGISGLSAAYIAHHNGHEVHLFEQDNYFGGHSNTIDLNDGEKTFPVDTGFLVHNRKTYPNLIQMFQHLAIETSESQMTLSIKILKEKLEWGGTNLSTLIAQKRNLFRPRFYRMVFEILKFNKNSQSYLNECEADLDFSLGDLLKRYQFSQELMDWYIIPMAAAIWSTPANKILDFPASTFLRFCINHNLLQVNDRPIWRTVSQGSRQYVNKITSVLPHKYLNAKVESLEKTATGVEIIAQGKPHHFDLAILACHADQSLALLKDPSELEKEILSPFKYQMNTAIVHSDIRHLPNRKSIWSAWNYIASEDSANVSVSYLINELQPLPTKSPILVTLNPAFAVDEQKIYRKITYAHPLFDSKAIKAQGRIAEIQGNNRIYFAGAWQAYGFHEDGLNSALHVAKLLNWKIPWQ